MYKYFLAAALPVRCKFFPEEDITLTQKKNNSSTSSLDKKRVKAKERGGDVVGITRAIPVILFAAALFLTLCFITADTGAFGKFISNVLMGLFSYMAYTIPVFICLHAVFYFSDLKRGAVLKRFIFTLSAITMLAMTAYVISTFKTSPEFNLSIFYSNGTESVGGGVIGSTLAFLLMKIFGRVGLIILLSLALVVYVIYLLSGGGSAISDFFWRRLRSIANFGAKLEKRAEEKRKRKKEGAEAKYRAFDDKKNGDFYNDEYFGTDNGVSRLEIPELGILETKNTKGTAHILRETVVKNIDDEPVAAEELSANDEAAYRKAKFNDIFIDADESFVRSDNPGDKFRSDDIVYEQKANDPFAIDDEPEEEECQSEYTNAARAYGIDDSADAVFTESFDPYDIAMNERRKDKPSSKAQDNTETAKGFSEYIASMTAEDAEHLKKLEELDDKISATKEACSQQHESESAPVPQPEAEKSEEEIRAEALRKAEEARLAEQALLANYGYSASASKESAPAEKVAPSPERTVYTFAEAPVQAQKQEYTFENTAPTKTSNENDRYRFVNKTVEEIRIPYSSTSPMSEQKQVYATTPSQQTQYAAPTPQPQYNAQQTQPQRSATAYESTPAFEPKSALSFIRDDDDEVKNVPISANCTEFNFDTPDSSNTTFCTERNCTESTVGESPYTQDSLDNAYTAPNNEESDDYSSSASESDNGFISPAVSEDYTPDVSVNESYTKSDTFSEIRENSDERLEVSRSMLDAELEAPATEEKSGLDFSFANDPEDDEYEEFSENDAEERFEPELIPEEERNPDVEEYKNMFTIFNEEKDNAPEEETPESFDYAIGEAYSDVAEERIGGIPFDIDEPIEDEPEEDEPPFEIPEKKPEKPKAPKADYSNYKFPPLDLLKKSPEEDWDTINREIQYGGEQLINTLDSFNITATIRGMEHGPRITRYSIVPAKGVRVNQIEKLADDIALALAAESIRIEAPIPGKSAVGVEVPNKVSSLVTLRDLLEADEFVNEPSKTSVCIGKSVEGSLVYGDIGSMPHVLIAGATGMGKSVCINSLITSILYKARPDEVKFIMIDPKKVEFAPYAGLPHLLIPVVTDPKQAAGALMWAVDEMNKRYEIIEKVRVKNIDSYNRKVSENPELGAPMSKIVIFIDELNDLMVQVRDPVENLIMLLAQKSRAAGIHLVIGTQRPSVDVLTGVIKANIPTRIACKVSSGIDSRTILEKTGAEKLIGKGDMLFAIPGKEPKRVQGAFVSDGETEAIVDFIKAQVKGEVYDEQALEDIKRAAQKCDKSKNGDEDDYDDDNEGSGVGYLQDRKFLNAVELAVRNGSVATSFLQRKLHIGYGKAAQYIDIMEDLGIVGEKNGSKARDVLLRSMEEWNEKLARLTDY